MKYFLLVLTVFLFCACTSLQSIQQSPQDLQVKITSGELLKVRERVRIITSEGTSHRFTVTEITDTHVKGVATNIAITDIAVLEVRQHNRSRTNWLTGAGVAVVSFVVLVTHGLRNM